MKIAIMQPYFAPYLGYFRLLSETDLFVAYDCVQFQRRGWMHRNKLINRAGELQWLTLPLQHEARDVKIKDLCFGHKAGERWHEQLARFPAFDVGRLPSGVWESAVAFIPGSKFVDYALELLGVCCARLGFPKCPEVIRSSRLNLPGDLRGQDRILGICRVLGATHYVNAPGGRELYDEAAFAAAGIKLEFLPPWTGRYESVLQILSEGS